MTIAPTLIQFPKVRRSPLRNILHYQFYVKNTHNVQVSTNTVDVEIYNSLRQECVNPRNHKISGRHICACLYDKRGKVVAAGINSFSKTHPLQEKFGNSSHKIFLHAEIDAVVKALRKKDDLSNLNLAIARVCRDGADGQAFPCDGCIDALKFYGVESVTYFDEERGLCKFKF